MAPTGFARIRPRLLRTPALALLLAATLPLGQAHCAWMVLQRATSRSCGIEVSAPAAHACCKSRPAQKAPSESGCACLKLPPATSAAPVTISPPSARSLEVVASLATERDLDVPALERLAPFSPLRPPRDSESAPWVPRGPPLIA